MKRIIWILFGWLALVATSQAASFDCAKAATKIEKLICADAEISKLDDELNSAYKTALQDEKQAASIRQAQKQWMKERNGCSDAACAKMAYEVRLSSLAAMHASKSPVYSLETLKSKCIEFAGVKIGNGPYEVADCRVSEFGSVGVLNGQTYYYYSIYCLIPEYGIKDGACNSDSFNAKYHKARAMAVFVNNGDAGTATLLMERAEQEIGTVWYEKPEFVVNSFGTFLYLPIHLDGTGAGNLSEYHFRDEKSNTWQKLETDSWTRDIKIPPGLSINKGIWPDLKKMTAEAYLYRSNDANCCATGGTAHIELTIEHGRLSIKSVTIDLENVSENK